MGEIEFESWETVEIFNFLKALYIIDPDNDFEDWKNDRTDLIQIAKDSQKW